MPIATLIISLLLIALGGVTYMIAGGPGEASPTALIPTFFGIVVGLFGLLALKPGARKHAMHAVSVLALLGVLASGGKFAGDLASGKFAMDMAGFSQIAMSALSLLLLVLCIRSFIQARRARQAEPVEQGG